MTTIREALAPFALYAQQMSSAWSHHDDSAFYGVKRPGAQQITYGDFRRALTAYLTVSRWRHKKRGSTYIEIGRAKLKASDCGGLTNMQPMVVYRSEADGSLWVRPEDEFEDGRFEEIAASRETSTPRPPRQPEGHVFECPECGADLAVDAHKPTCIRELLAAKDEALRHADIDMSMLLPEIANDDMRKSFRKTLDMIDKARGPCSKTDRSQS